MAISNNNLPECCSEGGGYKVCQLSCNSENVPYYTITTDCKEGAASNSDCEGLFSSLYPVIITNIVVFFE